MKSSTYIQGGYYALLACILHENLTVNDALKLMDIEPEVAKRKGVK